MFEDVKERIEEHISEELENLGLEIFEFNIQQRARTKAVQLLLDHPEGGVNIDECSHINKMVTHLIEDENLLRGDYTIEVSSPGLDRPLKTEKDFNRVKGKKVKFHLREKIEDKLEHDGVVERVDEQEVHIDTAAKPIAIPLGQIQKAVQII